MNDVESGRQARRKQTAAGEVVAMPVYYLPTILSLVDMIRGEEDQSMLDPFNRTDAANGRQTSEDHDHVQFVVLSA